MPLDAIGTLHAPVAPGEPVRIVSLVPSLTELLCALGLAPVLVGRTGFCIHPRETVAGIAKVGGTKDVNLVRIRALAPTHLVVNIDENEKPTVEALAGFIPNVIVTHPQAPADNLVLYRLFGDLFAALPEVTARAAALCRDFAAAQAALHADAVHDPAPPRRVLYCIWQEPWMTVSRDTYIARMLAQIGWQQWQPDDGTAASGARYPCFTWTDAVCEAIDCVLLSSEPYSFRQSHAASLAQQLGKPVYLVDGEKLSWYGSRAIAGLAYLQALRRDRAG